MPEPQPFWRVSFTGDSIEVSAVITSVEELQKLVRVIEVLTPLFEPRPLRSAPSSPAVTG